MKIYNNKIHKNRADLLKYILCFAKDKNDVVSIDRYESILRIFPNEQIFIVFLAKEQDIFDFFRISIMPTVIFMHQTQKINEFICHIPLKNILKSAKEFLST